MIKNKKKIDQFLEYVEQQFADAISKCDLEDFISAYIMVDPDASPIGKSTGDAYTYLEDFNERKATEFKNKCMCEKKK